MPVKSAEERAHHPEHGLRVAFDRYPDHLQRNRFVEHHPDTGVPVVGLQVPYWDTVLDMSCRVAEAVGLGYIGVDIIVDARQGPMLLEANARPGLAIQIANGQGLLRRFQEIACTLEVRT